MISRHAGPVRPLVCECGVKLVTLEEDNDGLVIGCPACATPTPPEPTHPMSIGDECYMRGLWMTVMQLLCASR